MDQRYDTTVLAVFAATLLLTFVAAWLGRRRGIRDSGHAALADERLNRWLVGLSAGAAANSGFVVTGAVGLGYTEGLRWLLLPLGWLVGDLLYWQFFPQRLNAFGRERRVTTLSELLTVGLGGPAIPFLRWAAALLVVVGLGAYLAAQWIAGQKFLSGAFPVSNVASLGLFALVIVAYTAIGGFRGSVYTDCVQAVIRLVGTAIALVAIVHAVRTGGAPIQAAFAAAGPDFLSVDVGGIGATVGFLGGFAAAALGFGLGQPHLVSRYLAGASPEETRAARWIYIGFVQFTWLAMTLFGVLLRGAMPDVADPEAGLSEFFLATMPPVLTGIIVADIFATIAATSNGLLVAIGQAVIHDLAPALRLPATPVAFACVLIGLLTMAASLALPAGVVPLVLWGVALLGAGLAPAVMVRIVGWRHTAPSLAAALVAGVAAALAWRAVGLSAVANEAAIGIATGLAANYCVARAHLGRTA